MYLLINLEFLTSIRYVKKKILKFYKISVFNLKKYNKTFYFYFQEESKRYDLKILKKD